MDIGITMTEHERQAMYAVPLNHQGELPEITRLPVEIDGNVIKEFHPHSFKQLAQWPIGTLEEVGSAS